METAMKGTAFLLRLGDAPDNRPRATGGEKLQMGALLAADQGPLGARLRCVWLRHAAVT